MTCSSCVLTCTEKVESANTCFRPVTCLRMLMIQIGELEGLMRDHVPSWLGFCHNDLQYGNMLLHVSSPQVGCAVWAPASETKLLEGDQRYTGLQRYNTRPGWLGTVPNSVLPVGPGSHVCLHAQARCTCSIRPGRA